MTVNNIDTQPVAMDKRAFAARWLFSIRHIDNLLNQGMPHLKIGKRRVRIIVEEADRWMKTQYRARRLGTASVAGKSHEQVTQ